MQNVKLNNGVEMPILGFGVYQVPDLAQCEQSVLDALEAGYRLIDTAAAYFNEEAVGKALKKSGIPRKELFITTKLWVQDFGYENAKKAFALSMEKLGLDYLDLYLIHQPFGDYYGAWRAMEELYEAGKIRAIGVSNFFPDRLTDLCLNNRVIPAVNQIECHPLFQQSKAIEIMKELGVYPESWGPFAEGKNDIFKAPALTAIASKHGKSTAQVMLKWNVQRGVVVIPKSVHKERIIENFDIFDFELTADEMSSITKMETGVSAFLDHYAPEVARLINGMKVHD